MGNYQQAIKDCNKAIELDPRHAAAYYNRGFSYGRLGNQQQEASDYREAAKLGSKDAQPWRCTLPRRALPRKQ